MALFLLILAALPVIFYAYLKYRSTYWQRQGIKVPPCDDLWLGHLAELQRDANPSEKLQEWSKQLGVDTFGLNEGGRKVLCTSNIDLITEVFVKQFDKFPARKLPAQLIIADDDRELTADVIGAHGPLWKRLRTIVSPLFSSGKMKAMEPIIRDSVDHLMDVFRRHSNQELDVHAAFERFTMDVINRIAFGREESAIVGDEPEELIATTNEFFQPPPITTNKIHCFFAATADFAIVTIHIMNFLRKLVPDRLLTIKQGLAKLIEERREMRNRGEFTDDKDFINMLLSTEVAKVGPIDENSNLKNQKVVKNMSSTEIVGTCTSFLLAGYDTTANSMTYFLYEMAEHPEIQQKLYEEITSVCVTEEDFNADNVGKIDYLDWCIKESLRKYPIGNLVCSRTCMSSTVIGDGIRIEKGVQIRADTFGLHKNKEIWGDDAEFFNPLRFDPSNPETRDRPQIAFASFGFGPRLCIGKRLAQMEMKLTISRFINEFRVEKSPQTDMRPYGLLVLQAGPTVLRLIPRE